VTNSLVWLWKVKRFKSDEFLRLLKIFLEFICPVCEGLTLARKEDLRGWTASGVSLLRPCLRHYLRRPAADGSKSNALE